ncbi:uncharacterized protein LOC105233800 [Bactrocera dorsalis]|uniref:Uncharacterized protein LOC105233800 n=1 Tax=Bactrocera dorsalis TaxID=27457 RepID=A0A6I9VR49_BACDO|nr:uncharacterized protein LOC105233800 [Bactrocera dorsalis]
MKVSTVSIVMAILCTLSSWRSAKGGDTIAIAVNNSSAIAVSKGSYGTGPNAFVPQPSTPSNAGSSSGSNGEKPETDKIETTTMSNSNWREEFRRRLDEIYEGMKRNDLTGDIDTLISIIQEALAKNGLPGAIREELNYALKILIKARCNNDANVKKAVYYEALCKLFGILYGGEESDKIETTTMSYSKWRDDLLRALDEIYKAMERDNLDRDIKALISLIEEYLAKAGTSGAMTAKLYYCLQILIKANGSIEVSVKNADYNKALCTLTKVVRE